LVGWQWVVDQLGDQALCNKIMSAFIQEHKVENLAEVWNPRQKMLTLFPFANGVYDLRTGEFRPARVDE
jgi:phage/plasmid-associated DNA primase